MFVRQIFFLRSAFNIMVLATLAGCFVPIAVGQVAWHFSRRAWDEIDSITRTVAHDIRSQYTLAYNPGPAIGKGYQQIRVEARGRHTLASRYAPATAIIRGKRPDRTALKFPKTLRRRGARSRGRLGRGRQLNLDQIVLNGINHKIADRVKAQLAHDIAAVSLHSLGA